MVRRHSAALRKVSIIIPVFNAEKTLKRCVESVLAQTYAQYELILIDDGSQDSSGSLCDAFAGRDCRISVIHQENQGVSAARNAGIDAATGDYVLFLDSDDCIKPDLLETYIAAIDGRDTDAIVGALELLDEQGERIERKCPPKAGYFGKEIWNQICINSEIYGYAGGKMLSRKLLNDHNIRYDKKLISQEDLSFCIAVYRVMDEICVLDYSGYCYYYTPSLRSPQYAVYLQNQLRILHEAQKTKLSEEADQKIRARIESLLYTYLYSASKDSEKFEDAVKSISAIVGLNDYLKEKTNLSERGLIAQAARRGWYRSIKRFFHMRDRVKSVAKRK